MTIYPKPYIPYTSTDFDETVIVIRNSDFAGIAVKPGQIAVTFQFCFFKKLVIQNEEDIQFEEVSIIFSNCFIKDLEISNIASANISVNIHASLLNGRVTSNTLKSIQLNNCVLMSGVSLTDQKSIELSYTIENIFPYWWTKIFRKINQPKYQRLIRQKQFYQIENPGRLNVRSTRKTGEKEGRYLIDWNAKKEYRIAYKLTKRETDSLKIHLSVNFGTNSIDTQTSINNIMLDSLTLSGNPIGKVSVENIEVSNWYLSDFYPQKEAGFYNIVPRPMVVDETKIGVYQCNFDNVWFDNVEFDKFERLSFFRSKLSKANFTSCSFPDKYERFAKYLAIPNIHYPDQRPVNYDKDQYEMLLQLKKAFEATGNYYEGLKLQAISYAALHKISAISGADRFILMLNKLSNNYGLSIKRPIYWFFGVTVFFYLIYLWSLGRIFQSTAFESDLIGYYFSFIDITHRSDFLDKKEQLTGLALTVDYLNKVVMGYLIYQFIAAFRKYGKNG